MVVVEVATAAIKYPFAISSPGHAAVLNALGIEHHNVRLKATVQQATIRDAEPLGREGSHLVDGLRQSYKI